MTYTWADVLDLEDEWLSVFGTPLLKGFGVGPGEVPILRQCLTERSQEPIRRYVASLPADRDY